MVKISKLDEFTKDHVNSGHDEPLLTYREFGVLMTAVKKHIRHLYNRPENETPRQKKERMNQRIALESAIVKLRKKLNREEWYGKKS